MAQIEYSDYVEGLTAASTPLSGTEKVAISQGGSARRVSVSDIIAAATGGITIGSTTISGGSNTKILYNNSGVVGEYTISGSGNVAMTTSPVFTTPNLGTPSAGVLSSCTGLPIGTGVSGLGTGVATALAVNIGTAGAFVVNGGALGTPSSGTLTNCTGLPLSTGVTGDLPFANLTQGSALSVLGVTGNATADVASIAAGTDNQVLRRSGTSLAFGAVNLASSNAVTGILPIANIATGTPDGTKFVRDDGTLAVPATTGAYLLASGGTASASNTFTANTSTWFNWAGTWTAAANNDYHINFAGSFTSRNTASDNLFGYRFTPSLTVNAGTPASQILTAVDIAPTFTGTAVKLHLRISGSTGGIGFAAAGQLPYILRPSTTGEVLVGTSSSGSRGLLMSATEFQAGGISTDDPTTSFNTGIRVAVGNIATANQGAVYFFPGAVSPTSGQNTGAHFAMSVNSSSGSATIRNVRIQTAGGFSSTATTISHNLNVRSIPNTMNIGGGYNDIFIDSDITQNASSSVAWTAINVAPTINQTSSGAGTKRILWYHPTETALLGSHYFIVSDSTTALSGFAVTPANAYVCIGAGTTTIAPFKLTSGTNLTTAVAGCMEYNGTNLFFTRTGTTREGVLVGNIGATAPATNAIGVLVDYYGTSATRALTTPNTWFGVVGSDGNTYKIPGYS